MSTDLILVAVSLFTWGLGEGIFIYFQPLYLQQWGASPVVIGAILGGVGVLMALVQIPAGYLSDRLGPRPVMWASWTIGLAATWIMALANSMPVFVAGLVIYGITAFVIAPMNSYITLVSGKWSVGRALTFVSAMYSMGSVLGPIIGGTVGEKLGLKAIYSIAGVIFVVSTAIIFFIKPQKPQPHAHEAHLQNNLWRNPRFLSLVGLIFITMFALYLPQPLSSNYLQNIRHLNTQQIGFLGSIGNLGNGLIMLFLGSLNPNIAFMLGQGLVALFSFLMWQGSGMVWFGFGYFALGGYRLCRATSPAIARPLIRNVEIGLAFGIIETANSISIILAPVVAGLLFSYNPIYIYLSSLIIVIIVLIVNFVVLPRLHPAPVPTL
jgi:MFS family permease